MSYLQLFQRNWHKNRAIPVQHVSVVNEFTLSNSPGEFYIRTMSLTVRKSMSWEGHRDFQEKEQRDIWDLTTKCLAPYIEYKLSSHLCQQISPNPLLPTSNRFILPINSCHSNLDTVTTQPSKNKEYNTLKVNKKLNSPPSAMEAGLSYVGSQSTGGASLQI